MALMSNCSIMLSICRVTRPWLFGGRPQTSGVVRGQVGLGHPAADPLEIGLDPVGDLALVEGPPAALGDQAIGLGEQRVAEHLALARGPAVLHPDRVEVGHLLDVVLGIAENPLRGAHVVGDVLDDRRAFLGKADRRLKERLPGQLPEFSVQRPPGVDGARHADRGRAVGIDQPLGVGPPALFGQGQGPGAAAGAVQAQHLAARRVPHQHEAVAAHPAGDRLAEAQHGVGRDRRIHRRAAGLEHLDRRQGRQRVRRRRRPMDAPGGAAGREGRPVDPVSAVHVRPVAIGVLLPAGGEGASGEDGGGNGGEEGAAAHRQ
jgi:hypothetical protein